MEEESRRSELDVPVRHAGEERACGGRISREESRRSELDDPGEERACGGRISREQPGPPGLAAERTTLAWRRSGVSVIAVGAAVARGVPTVDAVPSRPVIGVLIAVLGGLAFAVSSRQAARRAAAIDSSRPTPRIGDLWPVTASTVLVAVGAVVVVVLG